MRRAFYLTIWAICFGADWVLLGLSEWAHAGARWADEKARGER